MRACMVGKRGMCKTLKRVSGEAMLLAVDGLCFSRRLRVLQQPATDP
jgi:hypothetical protein